MQLTVVAVLLLHEESRLVYNGPQTRGLLILSVTALLGTSVLICPVQMYEPLLINVHTKAHLCKLHLFNALLHRERLGILYLTD